jgi:hypothetical protein
VPTNSGIARSAETARSAAGQARDGGQGPYWGSAALPPVRPAAPQQEACRGQIATQALNTLTNGAFTAGAQTGAITGGTGKHRDAEGRSRSRFSAPPRRTSRSSSTTEAATAAPVFARPARAPQRDPDPDGNDVPIA